MKILIVDDSKAMRMIVKRTLKQAGFSDATMSEAGNGKEGLEAVDANVPDLILCDWNMPEMNGIEFLQALREQGNETTFGFVTSERTSEMKDQASESGASFFISKPFTPEMFAQTIGETVQ